MKNVLTDQQAQVVGGALRDLLGLKKKRNEYGYKVFMTAWGTKTEQGLGHTVMRVIREVQESGTFKL